MLSVWPFGQERCAVVKLSLVLGQARTELPVTGK